MNENEFLSFAAQLFGVPKASLSMSSAYEEVTAWDSVMHLRLIQEIGDRYGVEIPFEKVTVLLTLGALFSYVSTHERNGAHP